MVQRFNSSSTWSTGTLKIIKQFVSGKILFLEQSDLDIDIQDWPAQLSKLQSIVQQQNTQKILIDSTMNPEILDWTHDPRRLTLLQAIQQINQVCPCDLITSDYTYYYQPQTNIKFFPAFLWTLGSRTLDQWFDNSTTVYDTELIKTKGIMCLNRNLTWHRLYLFGLLAKQVWFDKIYYSLISQLGNRLDTVVVKKFLNRQERDYIKSLEHLLPIMCESELQLTKESIPTMWMHGASSVASSEYRDCAINLVTETSMTEGIILTEKTCKPFMAYQIPIIVGPVGANQFLQDLGLDMFEDHIPWRDWDNSADHKFKMRKIVEFLNELMSKPTAETDILHLHQQLHSRLIKNKQHFHSKIFLDQLTQQFTNF